MWFLLFFIFIGQHCQYFSQSVGLFLSEKQFCSFGLSDHSGCSVGVLDALLFAAHSEMLLSNAHEWVSHYVKTFNRIFLTQLFSYVHIPTHRHTDSHTGSYIHLHTHMVAFILSTPQSASCGTSCLDWERGGPETNRISRGAWTATVLMGTLIQDGVTQKFRGKTINSNLLLLHLHRSLLYPNAYISFFAFRSPFPLQILTSLVTPC